MEFKIFLQDLMDRREGRWFSLPEPVAEHYIKQLEDKGHLVRILETDCDFDLGSLAKEKTVAQLNALATQLSELPPLILDNLDRLLEYETLAELIESEGAHFRFHEGNTLAEVAEDLVLSGGFRGFWTEAELYDFLNYEELGRDLPLHASFFEGTDGIIEYRK